MNTTNIIKMPGAREAPRGDRSQMETKLLTLDVIEQWQIPAFQRPLRVNAKVLQIAEELKTKHGGIIQGVISLGRLTGDTAYYLYDGQHRIEAAKLSGLTEFIADVRVCKFDTMAEMAVEFCELNTQIARLRPDDIMRALEGSNSVLRVIRKECPYVGYENIRRGPNCPVLSMSAALRCWRASEGDTPSPAGGGSATSVLFETTVESADELVRFLKIARQAWGTDMEAARLWGNLNLTICMWMWRKLVVVTSRHTTSATLSVDQFKRCLMSVAANTDYLDFLLGRQLRDRDRSPAYSRLKATFVSRMKADGMTFTKLPAPAWASKQGGAK